MSENSSTEEQMDIVQLRVNLNRETADALKQMSDSSGESITEVIRRSIALHKFVKDAQESGKMILTRDLRKGDEREIVLLE